MMIQMKIDDDSKIALIEDIENLKTALEDDEPVFNLFAGIESKMASLRDSAQEAINSMNKEMAGSKPIKRRKRKNVMGDKLTRNFDQKSSEDSQEDDADGELATV